MKKKMTYKNSPLRRIQVVKDFLPKPDQLILKETNIRITLNLSRRSIEYFKKLGQKMHAPYQKLIRSLVDEYTAQHH